MTRRRVVTDDTFTLALTGQMPRWGDQWNGCRHALGCFYLNRNPDTVVQLTPTQRCGVGICRRCATRLNYPLALEAE